MAIDGRRCAENSAKTVNALKASRCALITNNYYNRIQRINQHIVHVKLGRKLQNNDQTFFMLP